MTAADATKWLPIRLDAAWLRSESDSPAVQRPLGSDEMLAPPLVSVDRTSGYSQPFSSAMRTASARLRASSFCMADERWLRTVPGER